MWHGTWQEANEDGCSRWEVLDTPDACHCQSLHSVGPSGGGKWAPGTCSRAWPEHRMVQRDGVCGCVLDPRGPTILSKGRCDLNCISSPALDK